MCNTYKMFELFQYKRMVKCSSQNVNVDIKLSVLRTLESLKENQYQRRKIGLTNKKIQ